MSSILDTLLDSICEEKHTHADVQKKDDDDDGDLIFGSLEGDIEVRTNDSANTVHSPCDSMLSIGDGDRESTLAHEEKQRSREKIAEQFIKMANFRVKHRQLKLGLSSHWKDAAKKAGDIIDPWLDFHIEQYVEEIAVRHEYDPIKSIWNKTEIRIKMEAKPFGNGSMRECFRLKKLEISSSNYDWDSASNYIAKRYIDSVPNERYFDDVMMQMTTKLWAARYNYHKPPKKVDIIQMSVLEFKSRHEQSYYHLETFIEGTYIKYNSNSGFVCDDTLRHTPQAFSHFTYEASCHQQIVVDIQGVGDLYTDPQIHTHSGTEYGDGNLGIRGMALFFYTHECNPICSHLKLTPFDLSTSERERLLQKSLSSPMNAATVCRGSEKPFNDVTRLDSYMRRLRCQSTPDESDGYGSATSSSSSISTALVFDRSVSVPQADLSSKMFKDKQNSLSTSTSIGHIYSRSISESSIKIEDLLKSQRLDQFESPHRPSSVLFEKSLMETFDERCESILGKIHFEICKCYQTGRFTDLGAEDYDEDSAFFHLEQAAILLVKEAVFALSKVYLDLPRDLLTSYVPKDQADSFTKGLQFMLCASELRETEAHLYLGQFYEKGVDSLLELDSKKAIEHYAKYIDIREIETIDDPTSFYDQHDIVARLATLYKIGPESNYRKAGDLFNKAGEMATAAMKGRIATKYYQAAEEAYALEPDEEP